MLDIYTDYLICSFGQASATGLARLLDHEISHDAVTCFLSSEPKTSAALWHVARAFGQSRRKRCGRAHH